MQDVTGLKTAIKAIVGRADPVFDDRIVEAINRSAKAWNKTHVFDGQTVVRDITHVAGSTLYLPEDVERPLWFMDKTNAAPIDASARQWDRDRTYEYAHDQAGRVQEWEFAGFSPTTTGVTGYIEVRPQANISAVASVWIHGEIDGTPDYMGGLRYQVTGATGYTGSVMFNSISSAGVQYPGTSRTIIELRSQGAIVGILNPFYGPSARYPKVRFIKVPAAGTVFRYGAQLRLPQVWQEWHMLPPSIDTEYVIWKSAEEILWQLKETDRATMAGRRAKEMADTDNAADQQMGDWGGRITPEDMS